jgi:hypothetical protein
LIDITIPASVDVIDERFLVRYESLDSLTFESGSRLSRIDEQTLGAAELIHIVIPGSVEVIDERCFVRCESLHLCGFLLLILFLSNFHSFAFDLAESPSNSLLFSQFVQVV